ncbi:MAG: hypothetical protein ACK4QW_16510, partial [Alphaproteobacteria bacterium]
RCARAPLAALPHRLSSPALSAAQVMALLSTFLEPLFTDLQRLAEAEGATHGPTLHAALVP